MAKRIGSIEARLLRKEGKRRCPKCLIIKPFEEYYRSCPKNHGFSSHCAECMIAIASKRHKEHPEEHHKYYLKRRREGRDTHLRKKYGIGIEDYESLLMEQGGVCKVCGNTDTGKSLAVDHNHATRKVRGLLCSCCNPAIGYLKDSPILARKLADYLENS